MPIGRVTQIVDCRESAGMGKGGALAQRGTISECRYPDVIIVGMSPGRRHVTKPVCDITSALRAQGVEYSISTMILNAGSGIPPDAPKSAGHVLGAYFGLNEKEIIQVNRHKVAVLHHGNVRSHIVHKVRSILKDCDIPAVVVCQAPVDYEDFAKEGVKTAFVMPTEENVRTKGTVMAIVSGITRGQTPSREKISEVIHEVMKLMKTSDLER